MDRYRLVGGATAVSIIGTACVLFGTIEAPAPHVMRYLVGSCIGVAVGLLYGLLIFPALSDITGLIAALAPVLLLCGSFLARPPFIMAALGVVLTFPLIAGLGATSTVNIVGALNNSVALFVGTTVALCSMQLFQTADAGRNRARLERSIRRDIARHAAGQGDVTRAWLSRMLDRIGLLAPRLQGRASAAHDLRALFADVRAAHASNQLRALDTRLHDPRTQAFHAALIEHVAAHFRIRAHAARSVDTHLLELLDRMRETAAASSGLSRSICRTCSVDCAAICSFPRLPIGTDLMPSDLSIDGVLIPGLLAVAAAALALSILTSRLLASLGLYRLFAARPWWSCPRS